MKKIFILILLLISYQAYSMEIGPSKDAISALNGVIKTSGITAVGVLGATTGLYLVGQGWKRAFLEKKTKNRSFFNNNFTYGLCTIGSGTIITLGSIYLILKSNHLVDHFS